MRRGRKIEIATNGTGLMSMICLGADFVSEHEWGITNIQLEFGLSGQPGIQGRTNTRQPESMGLLDTLVPRSPRAKKLTVPQTVFFFSRMIQSGLAQGQDIDSIMGSRNELQIYEPFRDEEKETAATAWSGSDFAIRVEGASEETHQFLRDLHSAAQVGDLAIWLGRGHVFRNAGLCLGIVSRMDPDFLAEMLESDLDRLRLQEADAATGIRDFLKAAGESAPRTSWSPRFSYFALSPRWATGEIAERTAYDVIYWLNPMDQKSNHYCWATVEDLMAWTEGKGPIPKK